MKYTLISKPSLTHVVSEINIIEDEKIKYKIIPTGFLLKRLMYPDYVMMDQNKNEVLKTKAKHFLISNRHDIFQNNVNIGYFETKPLHSYSIYLQGQETLTISLSSFKRGKKWKLLQSENTVAKVIPCFKKWGWEIELLERVNEKIILLGLALSYSYFQDA